VPYPPENRSPRRPRIKTPAALEDANRQAHTIASSAVPKTSSRLAAGLPGRMDRLELSWRGLGPPFVAGVTPAAFEPVATLCIVSLSWVSGAKGSVLEREESFRRIYGKTLAGALRYCL